MEERFVTQTAVGPVGFRVDNVVMVTKIRMSDALFNELDYTFPYAMFNKKFCARQIRVTAPAKALLLIFRTGKFISTGTTTVTEAIENMNWAVTCLMPRVGVNVYQSTVLLVNRVITVTLPYELDLFAILHELTPLVNYEPTSFCGLTLGGFRECPGVTLNLFKTGKVAMLKVLDMERAVHWMSRLAEHVLVRFRTSDEQRRPVTQREIDQWTHMGLIGCVKLLPNRAKAKIRSSFAEDIDGGIDHYGDDDMDEFLNDVADADLDIGSHARSNGPAPDCRDVQAQLEYFRRIATR